MADQPHNPPPPDQDPQSMRDHDHQDEHNDINALHAPIVRENLEPRDGYEPVPLWLVALFGGLIFFGGWYLAMYSGGWRGDMLDPEPNARLASGGAPADQPVDPVVLGEKLFKANCVSCHQADGRGVPGQYPPLAGSQWVLGPPHRVKRILLQGLEGPVTVKGETYNGNMPTFGPRLKDDKLAAVLTFIRQAWGNDAAPISAASVAATRAATQDRTQPWTADKLFTVTQPDHVQGRLPAPADSTTP